MHHSVTQMANFGILEMEKFTYLNQYCYKFEFIIHCQIINIFDTLKGVYEGL